MSRPTNGQNQPVTPWRGFVPVVLAVVRRPSLWATAIRQAWRLRRPGWWRRTPFLPVPDAEYLRFRMLTQYGDPAAVPDPHDVVIYLDWCRRWAP